MTGTDFEQLLTDTEVFKNLTLSEKSSFRTTPISEKPTLQWVLLKLTEDSPESTDANFAKMAARTKVCFS